MWLFGYGSLIWKVDFPYERRLVGYIQGYVRRFYHYSTDHRGTEEYPGRVVTLLPSQNPEDQVWGVAYEIADDENNSVLASLDHREKNGYERVTVTFYPSPDLDCHLEPFDIIVYIGLRESKWFAGEASIEDMAERIVRSKGKSGYNLDYLCQLAASMRTIAPQVQDRHLFALEERALNIITTENTHN